MGRMRGGEGRGGRDKYIAHSGLILFKFIDFEDYLA
jgi:hypothetical protein